MAIPPTMFPTVAQSLASVGLNERGRIVVEKPFGRDLASAVELNATLHSVFPEERIFRIDHYLGKESVEDLLGLPVLQHVAGACVEPQLRAQRADHHERDHRRRGARQLLRQRRRDPRRDAEPPAAGHRAGGDGAAGRARRPATCRTRRPRCSRRCVRSIRPDARARAVRRIPRRTGRRSRLDRRDVCRRAPGDRLVAMGRRAVVRALRQGAAGSRRPR